ncbi:alpha/beta hydrolase [Microbacterium sp. NRRL B-14842]|uniref:alpha/beta hydrolase n=1 Tax=Microbacterium sp. NRRL B-14842 TaxID=3162881 RepID=UPI003D2C85D5
MPSASTLLVRTLPAVGRVTPRLAGDLAYRLFFSTRPRMAVRAADAATHEAARRGSILVRDIPVTTYTWGGGPPTVLLLHGWRGRASQFAPLVRELVAEGLRVVAFDAPAHGSSGGRRTDIRDWVEAAQELEHTHGPFSALIGHSFGGLAALTVARTSGRSPPSPSSPVPRLRGFPRPVRARPPPRPRHRGTAPHPLPPPTRPRFRLRRRAIRCGQRILCPPTPRCSSCTIGATAG